METCGNNMRNFREAAELTLEEMAEIFGLAERGDKFLSITKLYKVSRCMNLTLDKLLFNLYETTHDKNYYKMKYFIFEQLNCYELQLISMIAKHYLKLRNEVKKIKIYSLMIGESIMIFSKGNKKICKKYASFYRNHCTLECNKRIKNTDLNCSFF